MNLRAATADFGTIVLLPAFQMSDFIHLTGDVETLLLRRDLVGAEHAHQNLGHVGPPPAPACYLTRRDGPSAPRVSRPYSSDDTPCPAGSIFLIARPRTAPAVAGKGRRAWIRVCRT